MVNPGQRVQAGEKIGTVGAGGGESAKKAHLHLGWYDPSGAREEAASGAINPYPLLEWIVDSGGSATGAGLAPGVAAAQLPAYCAPLEALGLVPEVANPAGGPTIAGAATFSGSSGVPSSAAPGGNGSGGGSGSASEAGQQVVEEAKKYLGTPYVLGGLDVCDPGLRMDCTCLTRTVYAKFGYTLPDCPTCLWDYGEPVSGPPQAGDLLIWDDPGDGTGGHAAISMGNGQIIHANMGTMDVAMTPMWDSPQYMGARRLLK
jgi:cell wall-associated NlpC family hydrolase